MRQNSIEGLLSPLKLNRRRMLSLIGGTTAITLIESLFGQPTSSEPEPIEPPTHTAAIPGCIVRPEQIEGPYFVNEKLNRSDIRSDPADGSVKVGVPLELVFQVSQVDGQTCKPLSGAVVHVWHCDAEGIYSDVKDPRFFNTVGKKFLRGYQVTDTNGMVKFTTIYPGWYPDRAVHIHFKIRTNSASHRGHEFTSQLYFDDKLTDQIYNHPPYKAGEQRTLNHQDGIFQDGGEQLMLQLTPAAEGYVGKFAIGLE